ncbi:serine/threonine-protein kinase [Paraliomyxa miuraensis]|uniref:serine/threonine-protein kinase n=1 Tax=Paraliomyxa miuraensis TaxID=376150 RepID=UPI002250E5B8|nr:serine/threonine-protein kinase [Paraliomyxa miuraensis]MCX4243270.1 serine/threonine-protein kinase [Paraliomyxa miuraensis]
MARQPGIDAGTEPRGKAGARVPALPSSSSSSGLTPIDADVDADCTGSPVPSSVVRAAADVRDPRMKGIVLARMFGREVEPQRIGRFVLLDRLGEGGMGVVYAAYDDRLDRKVAVKVLRSAAAGPDPTRRRRLLQEARALARLSHPNIVTVHEVGTHDDDVFIAMEHVRGQSLDRWLERAEGAEPGGRTWREVVAVLSAAGRGLAAAHRAGIVHRDFKPHNVIVGDDGVVKVLDFGLARVLGPTAEPSAPPSLQPPPIAALTRTGATVGTPAYMAPEQHQGAEADERSDQFAFFVSLYQALHRQLPFPTDSMASLSLAVTEGNVRSPPVGSSVPRWLHRAVLVGLSRRPSARYPTMEDALAAITRDPASRRRRALALGALVVVVSTASATLASAWSSARRPCDHGAREMDEAWGPTARARTREGVLASGMPLAEETWARLEPRLTGYAQAWADARDQACEQHREGSLGDALYDRRVVCLELRRTSLEALVELLGSSDRATAERALLAAAGLPSADSCRGPAAMMGAMAPPSDPELARRVRSERRRLARVVQLEALGRYAEGIEQAHAVVEVAERLGHRPLLAEAMVREGSLAMEHAAPDSSERLLTEALGHALASDHVEVAVEALARRIFVRSERMRTPERAADDVTLGASLLERLHGDLRHRSLYLNNVGVHHMRREAHEESRRVLERALEAERALDPDDPAIAQTLGNLAIAEEQLGNDARALEHLERARAIAERVLGPHHPTSVELARLRGELLHRTGHFRAAESALLEVRGALREAVGPRSPLHHTPLVLLGELALEQRRYAQAEAWFRQAVALELSSGGGGEMYEMLEQAGLARAWWGRGEAERGRAVLEHLATRGETTGSVHAAGLRYLLGTTLLLHGHPEPALPQLQRARALEQQHGTPHSSVAAWSRIDEARALRRLERAEEAEAAAIETLAMLEGTPRRRERALALLERSLAALAQGHREPAVEHARAAMAQLQPWGEPDHPDHAHAASVLARALRAGAPTPAEHREADALADRARTILRSHGDAFAPEFSALDAVLEMSSSP